MLTAVLIVGSCVQLAGFYTNQDQYLSRLIEPRPFAPFGELLHVHSTDEGGTQYEIYKVWLCAKQGILLSTSPVIVKMMCVCTHSSVYLGFCLSWRVYVCFIDSMCVTTKKQFMYVNRMCACKLDHTNYSNPNHCNTIYF